MKKIPLILTLIIVLFSTTGYAQWAVSSNGNCLYDVFGNVISGSCQTSTKCKYKESGTTRKVCIGVPTPLGCLGFEYTEKFFVTECPLDGASTFLCLSFGVLGCFFLIRKNNQNYSSLQAEN